MNPRFTRTSCRRDSSLVNQIKIKTGYECDHLRFKNAFFREVIDQLWLNEHRVNLHHNCAEYFKVRAILFPLRPLAIGSFLCHINKYVKNHIFSDLDIFQ